jgi:deazaflavin-dependent oxidoreductase (nitroreductase family)
MYGVLRLVDPVLRAWWRAFGIGITAQLTVRGRRTGRERSVLVGLLNVDGHQYVGHPNGPVDWTHNLAAAGQARVAQLPGVWATLRAVPLSNGPERDAVIAATARQQPFPGNLVYRAAQRHIRAVGVYFRLEVSDSAEPDAVGTAPVGQTLSRGAT